MPTFSLIVPNKLVSYFFYPPKYANIFFHLPMPTFSFIFPCQHFFHESDDDDDKKKKVRGVRGLRRTREFSFPTTHDHSTSPSDDNNKFQTFRHHGATCNKRKTVRKMKERERPRKGLLRGTNHQ